MLPLLVRARFFIYLFFLGGGGGCWGGGLGFKTHQEHL